MSEQKERGDSVEVFVASPLRLFMLMTHYRSPINFTPARMAEADKVLKRWLAIAKPNIDPPPIEVLEALTDDMNTPKAIAAMHVYRSKKDGAKLFAAMRFLGLVSFTSELSSTPDDWRTLPRDHSDKIGFLAGPDTLGNA